MPVRNFTSREWMFYKGQIISISLNQALFSITRNIYDHDGRTTFTLSNLRRRTTVISGTALEKRTIKQGQKFKAFN